MADRLLPLVRDVGVTRVGGAGALVVTGVVVMIWALTIDSAMLALIGALIAVVFTFPTAAAARTLRTPGLLLTPTGYVYNGCSVAWSDIAGFALPDGEAGITHIKVKFVPGVRLTGWAYVSASLSKVGLYLPPTVIPIADFETGGQLLPDILTRWWKRYRSP